METAYKITPEVLLVRDIPAGRRTEKERIVLERHFNDLYAVFLHKLTEFAIRPGVSEEEASRLKEFFDEVLKARRSLEN